VVSASVIRDRVGFLAEIAERRDIRKLAEAAAANPVLVDALFDLAAAEGDLLTRLAEVIRTANGSGRRPRPHARYERSSGRAAESGGRLEDCRRSRGRRGPG
jgi:hypothetical protein